jgi:inorganic pyrophosphatase
VQPLEYTPVATGKAGTKQYRIYYYKNADDAKSTKSSAISPWHHIGYKSDEMHNGVPLYRFVNEIPKNTIEKYEIATTEVANPLKQDVKNDELRVFKYGKIPFNYGAIPQTWEDPDHESKETTNLPGDNDPVDVVEISDKALQQGYVYDVKPIGILALIDENETDWKVIAVAKGSKLFSKVNDASSLEQHAPQLIEKIKDWFIHYKTADGKKENTLALNGEIKDPKFTVDIIEACHQQWDSLTNRLDEVKLWVPPITHSI